MSSRPVRAIGGSASHSAPNRAIEDDVPARALPGPITDSAAPAGRAIRRSRRPAVLAIAGVCALLAAVGWVARAGIPDLAELDWFWPSSTGLLEATLVAPLPGDEVELAPPPITPDQMAPGTLLIPALGVYAPWTPKTVHDGELPVPADPERLALNSGGGQPCGRQGTILLAGHVAVHGVRGALWPLAATEVGTVAWLRCGDGELRQFAAVAPAGVVPKGHLPRSLDTEDGPPLLVLVTCGGPVRDGHYVDNVIGTFRPVA